MEKLPQEAKAEIYARIYALALVIPAVSVAGVLLILLLAGPILLHQKLEDRRERRGARSAHWMRPLRRCHLWGSAHGTLKSPLGKDPADII